MAKRNCIYRGIWTWTCLYLLTLCPMSLCQEYSTVLPTMSQPKIIEISTRDCVSVSDKNPCIYADKPHNVTFTIEGSLEHKHVIIGFTTDNTTCNTKDMIKKYQLSFAGMPEVEDITVAVDLNSTQVAYEQDYYFCISNDDESTWIHQGTTNLRARRINVIDTVIPTAIITGIRAEGDRTSVSSSGVSAIPSNKDVVLRVFGFWFTSGTTIRLTARIASRGDICDDFESTKPFDLSPDELSSQSAKAIVNIPDASSGAIYFICVKNESSPTSEWIHQGSEPWMAVTAEARILPLWLQIIFIIVLLTLSGLFSGLNLGLMAMDRTELRIIENTGTEKERKYAKIISPVRKLGNYLLCTLLLGNVLVNSSLTILLDDLTSGAVAIVGSTLGIVIFGEILPQAICSRHGLVVGARTIWITRFFMLVTCPLSFPISKLLDWVLGEEIGNVYNRERLKELIRVTNEYHDLQKDEVNIISGALELSKKSVKDVMTKLDDVFMLPYDSTLDFETMSHIMKQGYTRIPIFDNDRSNIIALLNIKDLAFVDPDDNTPLKTLCQFYNHPCNFVFEDTTLATMLDEFKKGQSHIAIVQNVNTEGEGDPFYEVVGVVTLEDVIEEIIQSEIVDETDVVTDNRRKLKRQEAQVKQDFSAFAQQGEHQVQISPQMALATFQYLSTAIEPFKPDRMSEIVLRRLMKQDIFYHIKIKKKEAFTTPQAFLYHAGKPADYFILILEGRAQVTIGRENLVFECGPFAFFGLQALSQISPQGEQPALPATVSTLGSSPSINAGTTGSPSPDQSRKMSLVSFVPDYTVQAVQDLLYMCVKRSLYQAALRATLMERTHNLDPNDDPFKQVDKFHSDSLERLAGMLKRGAPGSVRSSARSFAELPALSSASLRMTSTASPLAATTTTTKENEAKENVRNRALSQPETTLQKEDESHKYTGVDTVAGSSNSTATPILVKPQSSKDFDKTKRKSSSFIVDVPDEISTSSVASTNNSHVQNGQIPFQTQESSL